MKKSFFVYLLILLVPVAHARYISPLSGPGVEVKRVFVHEDGAITLYIAGNIVNLDSCSATYRVYIPGSLPGKEAMTSVALVAMLSKKTIGLHGSGCSTTPFWGGTETVPVVNNLWIFE